MKSKCLAYLTNAAVALSCNLAVATVGGANLPPSKEKATAALGNLAVPFEENRGQADAQVAFQARTLAGPLFVTKNGELVWSLTPSSPKPQKDLPGLKKSASKEFVGPSQPSYSVVEKFVGGSPKPAGATPGGWGVGN